MVEALMSISIMMISVMAPITLSTQSAKYARYTLNKITASYLAEEQVEMMVNFKKSLDIYCFDNTCVAKNGFDEFVQKVTPINRGLDCETYKADGSYNVPCYFDESSFVYTGTLKPEVTSKIENSCKFLYTKPDDIMSCTGGSGDSNKSIFTRKMYIDNVDDLDSGYSSGITFKNSVKLTSWVCINNKDCKPEDPKATTLVYFIYK